MIMTSDNDHNYKRRLKQYRKSTMGHLADETAWTAFRKEEKKYKAKYPPPSLDEVLDLAALSSDQSSSCLFDKYVKQFKTKSGRTKAFGLEHIPGLIFPFNVSKLIFFVNIRTGTSPCCPFSRDTATSRPVCT